MPRPLRAGDRLPSLALPAAPDSRTENLRSASRDALILLLLPRRWDAWKRELEEIARAAAEIEQWCARIVAVIAADLEHATRLREQLHGSGMVLADADGEATRAIGTAPDHAALVITDRYGQIYAVQAAEPGTGLPAAAEIEGWVTFLATQCPECGVIDEPGYGEWALT